MRAEDLSGETIVITAGATREELDPVRFISNYSSGKMGFALASAARRRGAKVALVAGTSAVEPPADVCVVRINSAEEMHGAVMSEIAAATVFIGAAAVADYRPVRREADKIKKSGKNLILELEPTPDILHDVSRHRHERLTVVGFAAETVSVIEHARAKLKRKNLDLIVANDVSQPGTVLGADTNRVTILRAGGGGDALELPVMPKREVADRILDEIISYKRQSK